MDRPTLIVIAKPKLIFRVINKSSGQRLMQYQPLPNWAQIIYNKIEFN
jgi:hypothetical protein